MSSADRLCGRCRGDDLDFNLVGGTGELGLHGRARRRVSLRHPRIPNRVHQRKILDVGKIDRRRQDLRLVAADRSQQRVDPRKYRPRLRRDIGGGIFRNLAGEQAKRSPAGMKTTMSDMSLPVW